MQYPLISSRAIISEYIEDTDGDEALNERWLRRIASTTIDEMCHHEQMEHKVALLEVDNYHAELPENFKYAIQIAYRGIEECAYVKRLDVAQWVTRSNGCDVEVNVKCDKCHKELPHCSCEDESRIIIDADELFRNAPPPYLFSGSSALKGAYGLTPLSSEIPSQLYKEFKLIRPAQHSFHNADYHIKGCLNLDKRLMAHTTVEYTITKETPRQIQVNREKGQILIAYFAAVYDEDGYRMLPDKQEYIEAVKWSIEERVLYKKIRGGNAKQIDINLYNNAKSEKVKYMSRVRDLETTPDYDTFKAVWRNQMRKIYPNFNAEYNFYKQENDQYWSYNRNKK